METITTRYTGQHRFYVRVVKRILDIIISFFALCVLSPLLILICLAVILTSGFPAVYRQERMGKGYRKFVIYKFRTMVRNADKIGPSSTPQGDARITPIGKILRASSLDELPQLWNILKGDMSLVGYRPDVWRATQNPNDRKYQLLPGLTGYAQVHGRHSITAEQRARWEEAYVDDVSFWTDCKILFLTVAVVLKGSY